MHVLGIDTANAACAVALVQDGRLLAERREEGSRGQAERLLPMILDCLAEAAMDAAALDRIGVNVGPGAFTGLRVGLAAARGLALATGRPLAGITGFEAALQAAGPSEGASAAGVTAVLLESRREDFYLQVFDAAGPALSQPASVLPEALPARLAALCGGRPLRLLGDGGARALPLLAALAPTLQPPGGEAAAVARLTAALDAAALSARVADPLYIRAPDVTPAPVRAGTGSGPAP